MPLSANTPLANTSVEVAVELFWELLHHYKVNRNSGSPHEDLVVWPTEEEVKANFRLRPELYAHDPTINLVLDVGGAAARILYRTASNVKNVIDVKNGKKLAIYTRSKKPNVDQDEAWTIALSNQAAPKLLLNPDSGQPPRYHRLSTHVVIPRELAVAPKPTNRKPGYLYRLFSGGGHSELDPEGRIYKLFTVLRARIPDASRRFVAEDSREDGSPLEPDLITIHLALRHDRDRNSADRFNIIYRVKIMQDDQNRWVPWKPEQPIKPEIREEPQVRDRKVKPEPRRSRSPPFIKEEPTYALSHRQRAIYRQKEARRLI